MNNILRHKLMEVSKQSGYKADFIESYMAQKNLLPKNYSFKKDDLDVLLKKYDKKISDFVKDTYAVKEQKNKMVQIHKLLNPKPNAPKYYTENDLANDLAHWFNNFRGDSAVIAPNFFIGDVAKIDLIGTIFGNAQIRMFKGKDIKKIKVHPKYADCNAIVSSGASDGLIKLFKKRKEVHVNSNNRFSVACDKKSKIIWYGYIDPQSNGTYDILDKSYSTGKTIGKLAEGIELSWSSRIKTSYHPTIYEN